VVGGRFWAPGARGEAEGMSLEDGIAESLGVKLGDTLTFDIAGLRVTAKVTSLRKVDWDSFRVNFFALFPPGPLDAMPATYIAAFRAPDDYGTYLAFGISLFMGLQAFTNLAVAVGLLPTKGLVLPFISYGGSAMLLTLAEVGVLLALARETG
jgi:putative ABC transport system permease protein